MISIYLYGWVQTCWILYFIEFIELVTSVTTYKSPNFLYEWLHLGQAPIQLAVTGEIGRQHKEHGDLHTKAVDVVKTHGKRQYKWQAHCWVCLIYIPLIYSLLLSNVSFTGEENYFPEQPLLTSNIVYHATLKELKKKKTPKTIVNGNHCGKNV